MKLRTKVLPEGLKHWMIEDAAALISNQEETYTCLAIYDAVHRRILGGGGWVRVLYTEILQAEGISLSGNGFNPHRLPDNLHVFELHGDITIETFPRAHRLMFLGSLLELPEHPQ